MKKIEAPQMIGGRWEVIRPLADGGMGQVFVAQHAITGRAAALKVLDGERCEAEEALARFQREARFAADIGHPGIVDVFDAGHDEDCGCLFIAIYDIDLNTAILLHFITKRTTIFSFTHGRSCTSFIFYYTMGLHK